jgi:polyisoprenoid-binding protein YceI
MATWTLDPAHSIIGFVARHMVVTTVRGSFGTFDGRIDFDPANPSAGSVNVSIDAASINTSSADRDNHLRSPDFLDVATYPTITFRSTRVDVSGSRGTVYGDLTIRGVTREVAIQAEYLGQLKDPSGDEKVAFNGSVRINREDWGLTWNVALEAGGWLVSKEIIIELEVQAVRVSEPVTS